MVEKLRDVSVAARTIQRDQVPEDVVGRGRLPLRARRGLRHRPDDGHRRRPVLPLRLALHEYPDGGRGGRRALRVVYDVGAGRGAARARRGSDGHALVWELGRRAARARLAAEVELDPGDGWLVRCDRIDFPPGGVAYRHTHPGPGSAVCSSARSGSRPTGTTAPTARSRRGSRAGRSPVLATASATEPTRRSCACWCCPASGRASGRSATSTRPTRRGRSSSGRPSSSSSPVSALPDP